MRLPIRLKGCGIREAEDRRFGQYLGAATQSVMYLIDQMDNTGKNTWKAQHPGTHQPHWGRVFQCPPHSTLGAHSEHQQTG